MDRLLSSRNITATLLTLLSKSNNNHDVVERCPPGQEADYLPPSSIPDIFINISYPFDDIELPEWEVAVKATFYAIAMFIAVVGNFLVLLAITINKKLQSATYIYIANLAVSDLIVGSFNMWMHLVPNIHPNNWPLGTKPCEVSIFVRLLVVTASALFLTVIATERTFSIVYPLKARFTRPYIHAIVIIVTWLTAIGVAYPNLQTRALYTIKWKDFEQRYCAEVWPRVIVGPDPDDPKSCLYTFPSRRLYYIIQVTVLYLLPIVVISVAYALIGYTLWNRKFPGNQSDVMLELQSRVRRKVVRMLVIVFVAFVVCYTPQQALILHVNAYEIENSVPAWVIYAAIFICNFNSSLNPILYAGLNDNFRKGLWEVINFRQWKRNNRVTPIGDPGTKPSLKMQTSHETGVTKASPQRTTDTQSPSFEMNTNKAS